MTKREIQCDQSLYERLSNIPAPDIDGLVDILTDFGRGRTSLDADIKKTLVMARHNPRPHRYDERHLRVIANELQHYGGHSVANLVRNMRDKPPLSYELIVNNVHAKLNGKSTEAKSVQVKECEIALALYGPPSEALTLEARIELSTSMKVLSGFFRIEESSYIKEFLLKGGLFAGVVPLFTSPSSLMSLGKLGLRMNPMTLLAGSAAFVGEKLSAEAYRITVPFVAEMGWIELQAVSRSKRADTDPPKDEPVIATAAKMPVQASKEADIVLTDEQGGTLMSFTRFDENPLPTAGAKVPKQVISTLNPLLQGLPSVVSLAEQQRGNYVLCTIPFESLVNATNGPEGARRAFVVGAKGVQEQAHLLAPETLENVLKSGVAWNALSVAVGQKHLQDINEKLSAIQEQLDQLGDSLKDLRREKLEGMMEYVQDLLDHHQEEGTPDLALTQLEGYLAELTSLESFFKKEMAREIQKVENLQTGKLLGGSTIRGQIEDSVASMHRWLQGYFQTAQLHIITLWLLNKNAPSSARYRAAAEKVLSRLNELDDTVLDSRNVYAAQMTMASSVAALTQEQITAFDASLRSLSQNKKTGCIDTTAWHQRLFQQEEALILLRVEDDNIQEASFVERQVAV